MSMRTQRPSHPSLPNLAKIFLFDSNMLKTSNFPPNQQKSPLKSERSSKRLKLVQTKSVSTVVKTQPDEPEKPTHTPTHQRDRTPEAATVRLDLKIDNPVKVRDLTPPKKHLPRLYTESMYKKYSEKVNELKERCIGSNVSSSNAPENNEGNKSSLRELVLKNEEQLQNSYSIKYLTVKDEGIGILSRRVPINQLEPKYSRSKSIGKIGGSTYRNEKGDDIMSLRRMKSGGLNKAGPSGDNEKAVEMSFSRQNRGHLEENVWEMNQKLEKEEYKGNMSQKDEAGETRYTEGIQENERGNMNIEDSFRQSGRDQESFQEMGHRKQLSTISRRNKTVDVLEDNRYVAYGGEQQIRKANTFGDTSPNEIYTSYVVNKFIPPHKLQAVKKSNRRNSMKTIKAVIVNPEKLAREVYMVNNFASFERQLASLNKLKSTMLRGKPKSNVHVDLFQPNHSETLSKKSVFLDIKQNKKSLKKCSYARLLNTMYTQEDSESDFIQNPRIQPQIGNTKASVKTRPDELEEDEELDILDVGDFQGDRGQKMLKNTKRSQSCELYQDQPHMGYIEGARQSNRKNLLCKER